MMKKAILTICLTVALLMMVAPAVMAYQIQVGFANSGYGPYQTGQGGEFSLTPLGNFNWVLNGYSSSAMVNGAIQTFCLEGNEYIYPNPAINDVTLSNQAVYGGNYPTLTGDTLSKGAAWLYANFATGGNFDGYATYNYTTGRSTSADQFQKAIWWLEGEEGQIYNAGNSFELAAFTKFGGEAGAKADAASGEYGVMVLNMWDAGHLNDPNYRRQDQLVYVGVPEPFTLLFLGGCLLGAGMAGRKFKI